MLGIRISAGVDPHDKIGDFNAALKAARTRATLLDEDVKALFIKALDAAFYQPVVSRLLLHDQRAAHDLLTIQQWVRECYSEHVRAGTATASALRYSHGTHFMEGATGDSDGPGELADLRTMVLDLKRQLAAFVAPDRSEPSTRGYTPRADKPDRRVKTRFAATPPLARGGNWSQSISKKVAFHRDTGATVPYCQNQVCAKGKARHWHRDCPNGGRTGLSSAYAFAEEAENSVLAAKFQHAIDHDNAEEFDALCMLAGGKPDIFADLSACSFCEEDGEALVSAVTEFSELARTAGASTFSVNTFTADTPVLSEPAAHSPPASVGSDEEWTGPPNPFCPPVTRTFADFIESTGIALGAPDGPPVSMNLLSAVGATEGVMGYEPATYITSDDDDEDASVALPQPRQARYRALRQGFRSHGFLPLPPELVDPDPPLPSSPPYSPPPYSSEDEAPSSGDSAAVIEDSSISSTHDLPPTQEAGNYRTLTLLRAGRPAGKISSWDWPARGRVTEARAEGGPKEKLRMARVALRGKSINFQNFIDF
ncbi:hypothetical protein CYMTET_50543 [Cymbomonas tetramitiformis]|uniref:Uncharacterized protein n=1 Tax=Cymbomonas tetramitiformis TaxID=36881 RepID=A0AAE0BPK9_9CHLO|nr:hypothetical protein CYMTET_50543 [Cymbomonas tetramitiformis]